MKIFGYPSKANPSQTEGPLTLGEVTLCATPEELRSISMFLTSCADEMVRMGAKYDHIHLSDVVHAFQESPQFVVAPARLAQ